MTTDRIRPRRPQSPRRPRPVERGIVSPLAYRRPRGRLGGALVWLGLAAVLGLIAIGPIYWMLTSSFKDTQELLQTPPTWLPAVWHLDNYVTAWTVLELPRYILNTLVIAGGTVLTELVVASTAAYSLSVLRPRGGGVVFGAIIATLFIPATIIFVPLFVTIRDLGLINNPLAIWLPAAASAFNVFLLKRFFDQIPRELLDASRIDGATRMQTLRLIVLPMSKPILSVVGILALMASWKSFLWPMLVLPDPRLQPVSVMLARIGEDVELKFLLAALVMSSIPVVVLFLIFQRRIIDGLGYIQR